MLKRGNGAGNRRRGNSMYGVLTNQGPTSALKVYSDWTERVAKGEVPVARADASEWSRAQSRARCGMSATTTPSCTICPRLTRSADGARMGRSTPSPPGTDRSSSWIENELGRRDRDPDARAAGECHASEAESSVAVVGDASVGQPAVQRPIRSPMLDSKGRVWMTSKIRPTPTRAGVTTRRTSSRRGSRIAGRQASFFDRAEAVRAHRHLLRHAPPAVR